MKLNAKELQAVLLGISDNVKLQRMRVLSGRKSRYCMVKCNATGDGYEITLSLESLRVETFHSATRATVDSYRTSTEIHHLTPSQFNTVLAWFNEAFFI